MVLLCLTHGAKFRRMHADSEYFLGPYSFPLDTIFPTQCPLDGIYRVFCILCNCTCFGSTYIKIGTIQRRLAWPLRKDDTQIREAFHIFYQRRGCGQFVFVNLFFFFLGGGASVCPIFLSVCPPLNACTEIFAPPLFPPAPIHK